MNLSVESIEIAEAHARDQNSRVLTARNETQQVPGDTSLTGVSHEHKKTIVNHPHKKIPVTCPYKGNPVVSEPKKMSSHMELPRLTAETGEDKAGNPN